MYIHITESRCIDRKRRPSNIYSSCPSLTKIIQGLVWCSVLVNITWAICIHDFINFNNGITDETCNLKYDEINNLKVCYWLMLNISMNQGI